MDTNYTQGFIDTCKTAGLDPEAVVKQAGPFPRTADMIAGLASENSSAVKELIRGMAHRPKTSIGTKGETTRHIGYLQSKPAIDSSKLIGEGFSSPPGYPSQAGQLADVYRQAPQGSAGRAELAELAKFLRGQGFHKNLAAERAAATPGTLGHTGYDLNKIKTSSAPYQTGFMAKVTELQTQGFGKAALSPTTLLSYAAKVAKNPKIGTEALNTGGKLKPNALGHYKSMQPNAAGRGLSDAMVAGNPEAKNTAIAGLHSTIGRFPEKAKETAQLMAGHRFHRGIGGAVEKPLARAEAQKTKSLADFTSKLGI